ncbi:MAG: queuosine precursor transporter [Cyanobacteria bacterium HKST-UBA04]|nr:queuosine precursor transporter [Cyanobacteria bacterium HKST-UBA05]MCA9799110.1 queuosine precursor transporter [Cyanobacteria bacterium HKST-UBA04]
MVNLFRQRGVLNRHQLYAILCALFVTCLVVADIIGSRLFELGPWTIAGVSVPTLLLSTGIIPFPVTFILTDLLNEFYGAKGARFVTWVGFAMALLTYTILYVSMGLTTSGNSPISHHAFVTVFSNNVIVASLTAYLIGQFLDIWVFGVFRRITRHRFLWLRATGSTVVSQLVDSFIVTALAFSGKLVVSDIVAIGFNNYSVKFIVAVLLTPLLYAGHTLIEVVLGDDNPEKKPAQAPTQQTTPSA